MSQRKIRRGRAVLYTVESLECRQLLSSIAFGAPVSTPLPAGLQPANVFSLAGPAHSSGDLLVTGASGGGLVVQPQADGTFTVLQTINTTTPLLGTTTLSGTGTSVNAIFTTAGLMLQQSNGSFSSPSGWQYPSDGVVGAFAQTTNLFNDTGALDLVVERFKPNTGDPTHGSIILAVFEAQPNLTFSSEVDTMVAADAPQPPSCPLILAFLTGESQQDVVAGGYVWIPNTDKTFKRGPSLNLSPAQQAAPIYGLYSSEQAHLLSADLVVFPAPPTPADPASAAAQVITNAGGSFAMGMRVDLAPKANTAGPPILDTFTMDGNFDLAVAVTAGAQGPSVAISPGLGNNLLGPPSYVALPSLVALAGTNPTMPGLVAITASGANSSRAYLLVTIPDESTNSNLIQMTAAPSPSFVGQQVTLVAVEASDFFIRGTTMSFFDGTKQIGSAPIDPNGFAVLTTSVLAAGVHTLTAQDPETTSNSFPRNSQGSTSAPLTLIVNSQPAQGLLAASSMQVTLPRVVIFGESGVLHLTLSNVGDAAAAGRLAVNFVASLTPFLGPDAVPLPARSLESLTTNIPAGGHRILSASFTIPPTLAVGTYYLVAQVGPSSSASSASVSATTLVNPNYISVVQQFGNVGFRHNVTLAEHLNGGDVVSFELHGKGTGTVTEGGGSLTLGNGGPDFQVAVDGTTSASRLTISQQGSSESNIVSLTLNTEIGVVDVRQDTPVSIGPEQTGSGAGGPVYATVNVKQLLVGMIPSAQLTPGADPATSTRGNITINGNLGALAATTTGNSTIAIGSSGAGKPLIAKIGTLSAGCTFTSMLPVTSPQLGSAQNQGSIVAPTIGKLSCVGDFDSTLMVTGQPAASVVLGSVQIGGSIAATALGSDVWAVNGNVGKFRIGGSVTNLELLGGAKLGPDGELTSPPAGYSGTAIASIDIGGGLASSILCAGLNPVDGILLNGNDKLLPGGSIGSFVVGGTMGNDSRVVSASLPPTVSIDVHKSPPSGIRFSTTPR